MTPASAVDARLTIARRNLAQAKAFTPRDDAEREQKRARVAQIEAWIADHSAHPAGGGR